MKQGILYERKDDNSTGKVLVVYLTSLGDVELGIIDFHAEPYLEKMTVTFANVTIGGGQSPNVKKVLESLVDAIEKDNQEHPLSDDFKTRKLRDKK